MHRRSPSASFSLAFRRFDFLLLAAGLCCAVALLPSRTARAANTADNVLTTGGTDLSSGATYSGGVPFFTSDATFTNSIYPATTFDTNGASLNFGTLDDLDATQAIVITDSSTAATISLNTAANATSGSAATDLIYLASGANLTIQGGSASPLTISLAANGNFDIAGTASANIGAVISGSTATIGFNKTGTGTLILSGLNTYTGLTTVSAGTLRLGVANAINTANSLTIGSSGTFDLGGFNQTLLTVSNAGTITNSSNTEATFDIFSGADPSSFSGAGAITGNLNVVVTLSNTNGGETYTGNWSNAGNITLNNNSAPAGGLSLTTGTINNTGTITNSGLGINNSVTISSNIGAHVTGLIQNSALTSLTLSGTNGYSGATAVDAGTLTLDFSQGTAPISNIVSSTSPLVLGGGTLSIKGKGSGSTDSQSFFGTTINAGNGYVTLTQNSATSLTASLGAVTHNSGGTLNFTFVPNTTTTIVTTSNGNDGSSAGGMLGTWASAGTGTSLSYVQVNGSGQIVPYTYNPGDMLSTAAGIVATNGTENYTVAAGGTAGANASINTLQVTGSGGTITPSGLTVNGIMNASSGTLNFVTNPVTIGANRELVITDTNGRSTNISSVIQDNGAGTSGVTLNGALAAQGAGSAGTFNFSGANTFTGPLSVNAGATLLISSNANLGGSAATVTLNGVGNGPNGTNSNGGGFAVATSGAILSGMRSIALGNGGGGNLIASGTYDVNFTGSGGLFIGNNNEGPTVLLTGNNTYTGETAIVQNSANSKLMISSGANLGAATTPIVADQGVLDILGTTFTSFGQHTVNWGGNNGAVVTIDIQSPTNTFTLNQNDNAINSPFTKTGAGTVNITVPQTWGFNFSPGLTLNGGVVEVNAPAGGSLQSHNPNPLTFAGGNLLLLGNSSGATSQTLGNVTVNAGGGTVTVNNNGGAYNLILGTLAANTTPGATLDFVTTGNGASTISTTTTNVGLTNGILSGRYVYNGADWAIVTTSATNNTISAFTGYPAVSGGALADTNNSSINDSTASSLSGSTNSLKVTNDTTGQSLNLGGSLTLISGGLLYTGANPESITGGSLIPGTGSSAAGDLILQAFGSGALTISSTIANGSGASTLTKAGTGTVILSSGGSSYTGATFINGGVLSISALNQISNTTVNINGGTLRASGLIPSFPAIVLGGSGGTIDVTGGNTLTLSSVISGNALTISGSDGNTADTVVLSASNSFSDGLFINSGTLKLNNASALGANASGVSTSGLNTLTFGSAANEKLELNGNNAYVAGLTDTSGNAVIENATSSAAATLAVFNGGNNTFAGTIQNGVGGGAVSLVKGGGLTLSLSGVNSGYTGATTIENGILNVAALAAIGSNSSIGAGNSTSTATNQASLVFGGGTLLYNADTAPQSTDRLFTIGASANTNVNSATLDSSSPTPANTLSFTNPGAIAFGSTLTHSLTLTGSNTGANTFAPLLADNTGATSLIKTGAGTWVVSNAGNTFSGGTAVSNGTLRVTGSLGAGPVTVSNGKLIAAGSLGAAAVTIGDSVNTLSTPQLSGTGSIAGPVTILGSTSPSVGMIDGASGATLTLTGGLTLNGGAISSFALTAAGANNPTALIATTGGAGGNSFVASGIDTINLSGAAATGTYDLFSYTGSAPGGTFLIGSNTISTPHLSYAIDTTDTPGQVDLVIGSLTVVTWTGAATKNWDIGGANGSLNWAATDGAPTAANYTDGNNVVFGDTNTITGNPLTSPQTITITASSVKPGSVVFGSSAFGDNDNSVNYVIQGNPIAGNTGLTLNGTASVTLKSPNTFKGSVAVNAGELTLQVSGALGTSALVSVASGAALQLQGGIAGGSSPLNITGAGLTVLDGATATPAGALQSVSGANSYAGPITIGAGGATITSSNPGDTLTLTGGVTNGGNLLTINGPGNTTISTAAIIGSGGLTFTGGGTLTLSAANGYTGLTTINDPGILSIPSSGSLAGSLTYLSSATSTIAGALGGAASVLTVNNSAGTLILNGANTYGGGTTLSAGTIRLGASSVGATLIASGALGTSRVAITGGTLQDNGAAITIENSFNLGGTITFSSPGAGSLTLDGSSLSPAPATVALTADTTLVVDNTTTINDAISGSGFGINTSGGTGTLILGGANTFTGGTTINASSGSSVVRLTNPNALQNSVVTLNDTSGIAFNAGIGGVAFGGLNGSVNLTLQDSAAAPISLTLGNNAGNNASYSGNLTGGTSLAKTGASTQSLSGNNTFTGGLTVSGGRLSLSGNNTFSAAANAITISGGTLRVSPSQSGNSPLGTSPIALSGGTLQFQPASSIGVHFGTDQDLGAYALPAGTSAGVIPMNNWNNAPGANGSNTNITGPIAGSLATNAGTAAGGGATTVSWSSGSTFSFGGATAGFTGENLLMGSFTNTGTTTVNFTDIPYSSYEVIAYVGNEGANGRTANISIGGTTYYYSTDTIHTGSGAFAYIPITNTNSASNPGGNYAVFTGLTGDSFTATLNQVGNSGLDGIEIIDQSIPISLPNTVSVSNSSTIDLGGYANVAMSGPASIGNATLTIQSSNPVYSLSLGSTGGVSLTGSPTFNVTSIGAGNLILGSLNDNGTARTIGLTGGGALTLNSAATSLVQGTVVNVTNGTLNSNATGALGTSATVNVVGMNAFTVGASQTISALNNTNTLTGTGSVTLGSGTSLTIGNNVDNLSSNFSGVISGNGALVKSGAGTLTLSGGNSYQGGTTINAGAVAVGNNSALGSGPVTLAGGTLQLTPSAVPSFNSSGSIGVHFGTDQDNGAYVLPAGTSAGVVPMVNWNNAPGASGSTASITGPIAGSLASNAGTVAGGGATTVSWSSGSTFSSGGVTAGFTGDNLLMGSFTNSGTTTVTFTNLPYSSYEVIAYVGNEGANGRTGNISIDGATYYYSTDTAHTGSGAFTYIPITNTNSSINPGGNYAVFTGVTGSSFTATLNQVGNSGLDGIEIINTSALPTASIANSIAVTQDSSIAMNGTTDDSVGPLSIGGNTLSITGTSTGTDAPYTLTTGAVSLSGNPTFDVANNGAGTGTLILGALSDGGAARTITITGNGAVTLASPAASLAPTGTIVNVTGGTLNLNAAGALGSAATVNLSSPGSLALSADQTLSSLNLTGTVNLNGNTLTVGSSDNLPSSFGGTINGGGSLRVAGTGAFALTSTGAVGNVAISVGSGSTLAVQPANGGTVTAGATGGGSAGASLNLGSGTLDMSTGTSNVGAFAVQQGSAFSGSLFATNGATFKININTTGQADELLLNGPGTVSINGTNIISLNPTGSGIQTGSYTLISDPSGTFSNGLIGTFAFSGGGGQSEIFQIGTSSYRVSLLNSATAEILSVGLGITGTWTVTESGTFDWSTPTSNWTSTPNVPQSAGDAATFGNSAGSNSQTVMVDPGITIGSLTFNNAGSGVYTIGGSNTLTLNEGAPSATAFLVNASNNNIISAPVNLGSVVAAEVATGTTLTLSGQVSGSTALNVNPDSPNAGTLVLSANNASLTAPITLSAGTLRFSNGSLGSGSITFAGNSTLQYANGVNTQDVSSQIQAIPAGVTATIDTNNNNVNFATGMSGPGGLTKAGAIILSLSGTNLYQGATTVAGGALAVDGSLAAASSVTVDSSAALGGSGTVNGPATVLSGGHLTPGIEAAGFVTTTFGGNLSLNTGSNIDFNLSGAPDGSQFVEPVLSSDNDHVVLTNSLSNLALNGTVNINGSPNAGYYELFSYAGTISGTPVLGSHPAGDNFSFDTTTFPGQVDLVVTTGSGSGEWISNSNQNYNNGPNWDSGTAPDGVGQSATFGTGQQTIVHINAAFTVGSLNFTSGSAYTLESLATSDGLTLNNGVGNDAQVNVAGGGATNFLYTQVNLASATGNTTFTIQPGSSLVASAFNLDSTQVGLAGSNQGITLAGGGTLELAATNTYTGPTHVNSGTLLIDAGASIASTSITVGMGGTLQLAGTTHALPSTANIKTSGSGAANDGAVVLAGGTTESIGAITSDPTTNADGAQVYAGNTTVGDGASAASLTATQILQNTLTINAGSTVTIAPSAGAGGGVVAAASATPASATPSAASSDGGSDPLAAIQDAIAAGSITSVKGQQLENRIAAIERLATTDPGLDVSLLESRVLAALPSSSILPATDAAPLADTGSDLLAADTSAVGTGTSGSAAEFASTASFSGSPAAVPEPSTLLLALLCGIGGFVLAARRRMNGRSLSN